MGRGHSPASPPAPKMELKKNELDPKPRQCQPYTWEFLMQFTGISSSISNDSPHPTPTPPVWFDQQTISPALSLESPPTSGPAHLLIPGFLAARLTSKVPPKPLTALLSLPSLSPEGCNCPQSPFPYPPRANSRADGSRTISLWAVLLKPSWEQTAIGQAEYLAKMAEGGDTCLHPQKRHP